MTNLSLPQKQALRISQDCTFQPGYPVQLVGYPQLKGTVVETFQDALYGLIVVVNCTDGLERWFSPKSLERLDHLPVWKPGERLPIDHAEYFIKQLLEDGVPFLVQYDVDAHVIVTIQHDCERTVHCDYCARALNRAKNAVYYWINEAPFREYPYNSTDDYDRD